MKCKTVVLWWLANGKEHPLLTEGDKKGDALMPIVTAFFPGINYYSVTGFHEVMNTLVIPAIKKRHPELLTTPEGDIEADATTDVVEMLASKGYEWQDDAGWMTKFRDMLAAA